jgi:hypothetical protein
MVWMKNGMCHLCEENRKLCKAHIIPECLTRHDKDELLVFKENAQRIDKTHPSGYWDDGILCQKCDGKLGEYDAYAKAFFTNLDKDFSVYLSNNFASAGYKIPNTEYDYDKLRRFLVATLWRASISKLSAFKAVDLGGKYSRLCKEYLRNEIDDIDEIDIIIFKLTTKRSTLNEKAIKETTILFGKNRIEGTISYEGIFGGYKFYYKVGQKFQEEGLRCIRISPKELIIPLVKYEDLPDYRKNGCVICELSNKSKSGT